MEVLAALAMFAAQFVYVLMLGMQSQNVQGRHYIAAAATSFLLGVGGWFLTAQIAAHKEAGGIVWLAYVLAGPSGICVSMFLHDRLKTTFTKWHNGTWKKSNRRESER